MTNRNRRLPGQSLLEFAIAFPFLLLILSVVIEFGFLFHQNLRFQDAAREGARTGAQRKSDDVIRAQVRTDLPGYNLSDDDIKINLYYDPMGATSPTTGDRSPGIRLEVVIIKDALYVTPLSSFLGWTAPLKIRGQASFRVEMSS